MANLTFEKLMHLLTEFRTCSIVTRRKDGLLVGRPMAIAESTTDGHLWFITHVESSAVEHITENPEIAAILQADDRYVSLSGYARTTRDKARVDQLWDPSQSVWFEKGKEDPSLILLEIVPVYGEYWDRSGLSGIEFKLKEVRALVTGETLGATAREHGTVNFG